MASILLTNNYYYKSNARQKVIYVAGQPLSNRRSTRRPGCFHFPKRKLNY